MTSNNTSKLKIKSKRYEQLTYWSRYQAKDLSHPANQLQISIAMQNESSLKNWSQPSSL